MARNKLTAGVREGGNAFSEKNKCKILRDTECKVSDFRLVDVPRRCYALLPACKWNCTLCSAFLPKPQEMTKCIETRSCVIRSDALTVNNLSNVSGIRDACVLAAEKQHRVAQSVRHFCDLLRWPQRERSDPEAAASKLLTLYKNNLNVLFPLCPKICSASFVVIFFAIRCEKGCGFSVILSSSNQIFFILTSIPAVAYLYCWAPASKTRGSNALSCGF